MTIAALRKNQRGMTLVEALIAMLIVAIAGAGVLALNAQQLRWNGAARETTVSTALAEDLVENISLWAWDDARLSSGSHVESDLGSTWTGLPARAGFTRAWSVAVSGKQAQVTVTVTGPKGSVITVYTTRADLSGGGT